MVWGTIVGGEANEVEEGDEDEVTKEDIEEEGKEELEEELEVSGTETNVEARVGEGKVTGAERINDVSGDEGENEACG